jgi:hypothetical protein
VQITEGNGKTVDQSISVEAIVGGGHAVGTMKVFEYSSSGGTFDLSTSAKSLQDLAAEKKSDTDSSRVPVTQSYHGVSVDQINGKTVQVTLTTSSPPLDRFTEIYYLLFASSEKVLQVNLRSGTSLVANFPSTWDVINSSLSGQTNMAVGTNSGVVTLSCTNFNFRPDDHFVCDYYSTLNNRHAQFRFPAN